MATTRAITTVEEFLLLREIGVTIFDKTKGDNAINSSCHPDDMVEREKRRQLADWVRNRDYYILEE